MATPVNFSHAKSLDIDMDLIEADAQFNSRSFLDTGNYDSTGVQELAISMLNDGQVTPILVEERKDKKSGKIHYSLISGFRRFSAARNLKWPKISARVFQPMEDSQRRYLNLIENTAREDLTSYDLAKACVEIEKADSTQTSKEIATKIGKSDSYVRNLMNAYKNSIPEIMERWKAESLPKTPSKKDAKGEKIFTARKILTTDWLSNTYKLSPEEQLKKFKAMGGNNDKKSDGPTPDGETPDGNKPDSTGEKAKPVKRPNSTAILNAGLVVRNKLATAKGTEKASLELVLNTLRWVEGHSADGVEGAFTAQEVKDYGKE